MEAREVFTNTVLFIQIISTMVSIGLLITFGLKAHDSTLIGISFTGAPGGIEGIGLGATTVTSNVACLYPMKFVFS
jgi:hypothetical protein